MVFSLQHTLESGQLFRWRYVDGGALICHRDRVFFLSEDGTSPDISEKELNTFLRADQEIVSHDHPYVQEAINSCPGLRIIRQDPWECLVTFIVSQNNHQKRIAQNVQDIARAFGDKLEHGFHAFPTPAQIGTEQQLKDLKLGYRAGHIAKLRSIDLTWLHGLSTLPYADAKKELCTLSGIGPKVADCILLFSLGFDQACPEDTWIKKVFKETGLTTALLGPQAGILQQFLFHYARSIRL